MFAQLHNDRPTVAIVGGQVSGVMLYTMPAAFDCVVCGSCVVDLVCKPIALDRPIGRGTLLATDPVALSAGGITANSGITLSRLGRRVAVLSMVGDDLWGPLVGQMFRDQGVDTSLLLTHPDAPTSTTVVAVDESGERSFLHAVGAPRKITPEALREHMGVIRVSRAFVIGYYSLMPALEAELAELFAEMRRGGCLTVMDAAGDGGTMQPLDRILPHLDVYVPSFREASHQTGIDDPRRMVDAYRDCGAPGIVGVKLGADGALLSERAGHYIDVPAVKPPGAVVDTTGAGDCFLAGLVAGLLREMPLVEAGRFAAACGACSVTAMGGWLGTRTFQETATLAGLG